MSRGLSGSDVEELGPFIPGLFPSFLSHCVCARVSVCLSRSKPTDRCFPPPRTDSVMEFAPLRAVKCQVAEAHRSPLSVLFAPQHCSSFRNSSL